MNDSALPELPSRALDKPEFVVELRPLALEPKPVALRADNPRMVSAHIYPVLRKWAGPNTHRMAEAAACTCNARRKAEETWRVCADSPC